MSTKTEWLYTLEKDYGFWHWSLRDKSGSLWGWHGAAYTKRGAMRKMRAIKAAETKRINSKISGAL